MISFSLFVILSFLLMIKRNSSIDLLFVNKIFFNFSLICSLVGSYRLFLYKSDKFNKFSSLSKYFNKFSLSS